MVHISSRPPSEAAEVLLTVLAHLLVLTWLSSNGMGKQALTFLVLPRLFASALLAYSFDYVPHRPHTKTR